MASRRRPGGTRGGTLVGLRVVVSCQPPGALGRQLVQAQGAQPERMGVEVLQVEGLALAAPGVLAGRQPNPFAHLVTNGLARPAQVAVQLAGHELGREATALQYKRLPQFGRPRFPRMEPLVRWYGQFEVHTDVDYDTHRPQHLCPQEPEPVLGVLEVAELVHEAFGIKRPPLGMPADDFHALEPCELSRRNRT